MTNRSDNPAPVRVLQRALTCARCGTPFTCDLSGQCWCDEEAAKLPMPTTGEDCLCRNCLRAEAERRAAT
jgi:hypothetical protein